MPGPFCSTVDFLSLVIALMDDGSTPNVSGERRKLENEKFSFEGEKKDLEKKRSLVIEEIARTKKEIGRLEFEITTLQTTKSNFDHRILSAEDEIVRLKRKINLL